MVSEDPKLGPVARRLAATERVALIEDEADIAVFLRAYFRASGYDLVHIDPPSVADGVAELDDARPDIVLLDLRLRGFSGMEIYNALRADQRWAFVPIVIVSAHASADPSFHSPRGIDAFIAKPFNTNTLADLVKERIVRARELAEGGIDEDTNLLSQDYVSARIADEIDVAQGDFSFAIVQLTSMETIVAEVGADGRDFVVTKLLDEAKRLLPDDVVLGITATDEVTALLPGLSIDDAESTMRHVLDTLNGSFSFPGGAEVPVRLTCGVATYPQHGDDADPLFMAADLALADALDAGQTLRRAT